MGSCADGTCDDPLCDMCVGLPLRFPPVEVCELTVQTPTRIVRCRLVKGHTCPCRPSSRRGEVEAHQHNPERDGAPTLAGERKRGSLAFEKRRRVGPHR